MLNVNHQPAYTPLSKLPEDYTWGCPPGFLCSPSHTGERAGCNIEAGLPAEGYICDPLDCIVAPPLILNQSWASDTNGHSFSFSQDYYNLDPKYFGLKYDIFQTGEEHNATQSKRDILPLQGDSSVILMGFIARRDISDIPGVCYNDCNDAALEQQATGKKPDLCQSDSVYILDIRNCKTCIGHYSSSSSDGFSSLLPSFAQFLNYCSDLTTTSATLTSTIKTNHPDDSATTTSRASTSAVQKTLTESSKGTGSTTQIPSSTQKPDTSTNNLFEITASTKVTGITTSTDTVEGMGSENTARPTGTTDSLTITGSTKAAGQTTLIGSTTTLSPSTTKSSNQLGMSSTNGGIEQNGTKSSSAIAETSDEPNKTSTSALQSFTNDRNTPTTSAFLNMACNGPQFSNGSLLGIFLATVAHFL